MSDPIPLVPGIPLSPEQKAQLAKENEKATIEAQEMAREQIARDNMSGAKPVLNSVAESIKSKLEREDFVVATDDQGNQVPPR